MKRIRKQKKSEAGDESAEWPRATPEMIAEARRRFGADLDDRQAEDQAFRWEMARHIVQLLCEYRGPGQCEWQGCRRAKQCLRLGPEWAGGPVKEEPARELSPQEQADADAAREALNQLIIRLSCQENGPLHCEHGVCRRTRQCQRVGWG